MRFYNAHFTPKKVDIAIISEGIVNVYHSIPTSYLGQTPFSPLLITIGKSIKDLTPLDPFTNFLS